MTLKNTSTDEKVVEVLTSGADNKDIARHHEASTRFDVLKNHIDGAISTEMAMEILDLQKSQFYDLLKLMDGATSYRVLVKEKTGRKRGLIMKDPEVLTLIEEMFEKHFPNHKSYSAVWKHCQSQADVRGIIRPSYHTVRRWIKNIGFNRLYALTHSSDQVKQKFQPRPGYKKTKRPLEWVQIDHTVMDILVVDEDDRSVILGRPYISIAIDLKTRVILGFYVSLLSPSAVSVAMLLENCVLPKEEFLKSLGLPTHLMPFHGLPEVIHTDNAKEFVSGVFVLNAKGFDITVAHRDIPQKHQGGHIESLIGKIMLHMIHPLPGNTGSNTVERKNLKSEKKSAIGLQGLRRMLVYHIHAYHETVHSGIGKTPTQAWNEYFNGAAEVRKLKPELHEKFKYSFYPEVLRKRIAPEGIELFRRFYYHSILKNKVRERVTVKFDPYDLSHVFVKIDDAWEEIPCVRNSFNRSSDYEEYRWERQCKGERSGTMTAVGARSYGEIEKEKNKEVKLTAKDKKSRKIARGKEDYRNQAEVNSAKEDGKNKSHSKSTDSKTTTNPTRVSTVKATKKGRSPYAVRIGEIIDQLEDEAIDFKKPPVFYGTNK